MSVGSMSYSANMVKEVVFSGSCNPHPCLHHAKISLYDGQERDTILTDSSVQALFHALVPVIKNYPQDHFNFYGTPSRDVNQLISEIFTTNIGLELYSRISYAQTASIEIGEQFGEGYPCRHNITINLNDGRQKTGLLNGLDLSTLYKAMFPKIKGKYGEDHFRKFDPKPTYIMDEPTNIITEFFKDRVKAPS